MSAFGDYKYVKQDRLGSETPILADVIATYADKAIEELWAENERLKLTLDAIEDAFVKERNIYPKMSISWCNWRNALKVLDAVVSDIRSRDEARKADAA